MLHAESHRLYSWWWDSHISPKNSKWLQENLTGMDSKVKSMIKLIEEDADSFARRAEMYYKKRPELMKLVEEFYRAYRALAERYDHATGALRQAHRTMIEAFPNEISQELPEDSLSGSFSSELEPRTPELSTPVSILLEPEDMHKDNSIILSHYDSALKRNGAFSDENDDANRKGLKQLNELFAGTKGVVRQKVAEGKARKGLNFEDRIGIKHEIFGGQNTCNQYSGEKEDVDGEIKHLQDEVSHLLKEIQNLKSQLLSESDCAGKTITEMKTLRETVFQLQLEKEGALSQCQLSIQRISNLEDEISHSKDDLRKLSYDMMQDAAKLSEAEERSLVLEKTNRSLRLDIESIGKKTTLHECELQQKQAELENVKFSLESLEKLHLVSQENIKHLSQEIQLGIEKSKDMELRSRTLIEEINMLKEQNSKLHEETCHFPQEVKNLREELILLAENKKQLEEEKQFHVKEKEVLHQEYLLAKENGDNLSQKHISLVEQIRALSSNMQFLQATVEELHHANAELRMTCKSEEEERVIHLKSLENMENICASNAILQNSLSDANEELKGLRQKIIIVEQSGEILCEKLFISGFEKAMLVSQLEMAVQDAEKLSERETFLENSLFDVTIELKTLRRKLKCLKESLKSVDLEKANLLSEKSIFLSQLKIAAQNVEKLSENNTSLEKSLTERCIEIEELREKLEDLEESYELLCIEESNLLADKDSLLLQLDMALQDTDKLSENNSYLEETLNGRNIEMEELGERLKSLEESYQLLCDEKSSLLADKYSLISKVEKETRQSGELSSENFFLEKCLHDANIKVETLAVGLKGLEESCCVLGNEKASLLVERDTLIIQVDGITRDLEKLKHSYADLEGKHLSFASEHAVTLNQLTELQEHSKVEKLEHETDIQSIQSQLAASMKQISLLEEVVLLRNEDLEDEVHRNMTLETVNFILEGCVLDMKELNLILSVESQKLLKQSQNAEKNILDLKHEIDLQKTRMVAILEKNDSLRCGVYLLLKELVEKHDEFLNEFGDDVLLEVILKKIRCLLNSMSVTCDENQQLIVEKSVMLAILRQLAFDTSHLRTEKSHLEQYLQNRIKELSTLWNKHGQLLENSQRLEQKLQITAQRENEVNAEVNILSVKLSDLQETCMTSQKEISRLVKENELLSIEAHESREKIGMKELENIIILEEALQLELVCMIFSSLSNERASTLVSLNNDANFLCGLNEGLINEISTMSKRLEESDEQNIHLKKVIVSLGSRISQLMTLEDDLSRCRYQCEQLDIEIQSGKQMLIKKDLEILEISRNMHVAYLTSQAEISKLVEEKQSLSEKLFLLEEKTEVMEEDNVALVAEVVAHECLYLYFRSHSNDSIVRLESCSNQLNHLLTINNVLHQNVQDFNDEIRVLSEQNMQMEEAVASLEEAYHTSQREMRKLEEANQTLSHEMHMIMNQQEAFEEEKSIVLEEYLTMECLILYLKNLVIGSGLEVKALNNDLHHIYLLKIALDKSIRQMAGRMEHLEEENMHLKKSIGFLENELKAARDANNEMVLQIERGKLLLADRCMELSEAKQIVQHTQEKTLQYCRELDCVKLELDNGKVLREGLEKDILKLSEGNTGKDVEITCLHEAWKKLEDKCSNMHKEVDAHIKMEYSLICRLKNALREVELAEKEITALLHETNLSLLKEATLEDKILVLAEDHASLLTYTMLKDEKLHENINERNAFIDDLKLKLVELEVENEELKDKLKAFIPLVMSLSKNMASLEEHTLSAVKLQASKYQVSSLKNTSFGNHGVKDDQCILVEATAISQMKQLIAKLESLQVVLNAGAQLGKEAHNSSSNSNDAMDQKPLLGQMPCKISTESSKSNDGEIMKDIQLDKVSSSFPYGSKVLYRPSKIESCDTDDQMLELWETAERDCGRHSRKASSLSNPNGVGYQEIEAADEERSEYPSSELMAEKELSIDKLELPKIVTEPHEAWKAKVTEKLASDEHRLSVLQTGLRDLKARTKHIEKYKTTPLITEHGRVTAQLNEAEGVIMHLIDVNNRLTRRALDYPASSNSLAGSNDDTVRMGRKQLVRRVWRASENIENLELEFKNVHSFLLKLEVEKKSRGGRAMERKSSIPLREYLYVKRESQKWNKRSFCGCIRPKAKG